MVKDGEDSHGLKTATLKKFSLNFSRRANRDVAHDLSCLLSRLTQTRLSLLPQDMGRETLGTRQVMVASLAV